MKATGLTSTVLRLIFVPLYQNGCPKIESNPFRPRFLKAPGRKMYFKPILII